MGHAKELEDDRAEMETLIASCESNRVKRELQPWLVRIKGQLDEIRAKSLGMDVPSQAVELEADRAEMAALVEGCARENVRKELQHWLRKVKDQLDDLQRRLPADQPSATTGTLPESQDIKELEADRAEMEALIEGCTRKKLVLELQPWLCRLQEQLRQAQGSSEPVDAVASAPRVGDAARDARNRAPPSRAAANEALPVVVIAGDRGTSKHRLLHALADGASTRGGEDDQKMTLGRFDTKYYTARVRYCVVDSGADAPSGDTAALLRSAEAIVYLWDAARPATFEYVRRLHGTLGDQEGGDERDRVQVCVAVEGLTAEKGASEPPPDTTASEEEVRAWCAENGFEHLRCPFRDADLEAVQGRLRDAKRGRFASILDEADEEVDSAVRLVEALECHAWPGLVRRNPLSEPCQPAPRRPVRQAADGRPSSSAGDERKTDASSSLA